jgi:hypothetical protein
MRGGAANGKRRVAVLGLGCEGRDAKGSLDPSLIVWSGNEDGQRRSIMRRIDGM